MDNILAYIELIFTFHPVMWLLQLALCLRQAISLILDSRSTLSKVFVEEGCDPAVTNDEGISAVDLLR